MSRQPPAQVVTFSGIDGAGKSTQIFELTSWLHQSGLRTLVVTFWTDVVVGSRYREMASRAAFKGDQGVGTPENPLNRRDKNVTAWPLTAARCILYLADALSLRWRVRTARKGSADVVIFDRYIYDELANMPLHSRFGRAFVKILLFLSPKPDVACVLDADPVEARVRKPEYPVEFVRRNRRAYLDLAELAGNIAVIEPGPIAVVQLQIRNQMLAPCSAPDQGLVLQ